MISIYSGRKKEHYPPTVIFLLLGRFQVFIPQTLIFLFPGNSSCFKNLARISTLFTPAFGFPCCLALVGAGTRRTAGSFWARLWLGLGSGMGGSSLASWFVFTPDRTHSLSRWLPTAHPPTATASSGSAQASAGGAPGEPRQVTGAEG